MKLLVLGGAGFIGTNLYPLIAPQNQVLVFDSLQMGNNLSRANIESEIIEENMLNLDRLSSVLEEFKPDRIFHFAANSDISASAKNSQIDIDNTYLTTHNLVQACIFAKLRPQVIFASSSAVYGPADLPITEKSPKSPISSYGWMKLLSEEVLKNALQNNQISKLTIVRFPNVTGKWQTHGVVKDLVSKLKKNKDQLDILGDGNQSKPYVLVNELCKEILRLLNLQDRSFEEVNLAPIDVVSVKEIVDSLIRYSKLKPRLNYEANSYGWIGDVPKYSYDTNHAKSLLGIINFGTSQNAIDKSIAWEWDYSGR
jgi:UDP-glucose 4-epimerase